jgi:hypothetical protein|tara:strand:+ start:308 stop:595 length:288 start_codon:yes stop_codon:yes gene_type:complete
MINLETYLGQKTNFELERAVRIWLITHPVYNTDDYHNIIDITAEDNTLYQESKGNIKKEAIYKREYLDVCFSNKNPNWKDGSLKKLVDLTRNEPQ